MILDSEQYDHKIKSLLEDGETYVKLKKDPTKNYQSKLINLLKDF